MLDMDGGWGYHSFNKANKAPEGKTMTRKITRNDVVQAAADKGIRVLEALSMMQAAAAKMGDEGVLEQLCEIKSEILFGDE